MSPTTVLFVMSCLCSAICYHLCSIFLGMGKVLQTAGTTWTRMWCSSILTLAIFIWMAVAVLGWHCVTLAIAWHMLPA